MVAKQVAHTTDSIGTSTTEAVAANTNRTYLLLINDSANEIYIKFGADAVANEGIRLLADGGSYECSDINGNLDTREVDAIATGAASNLLITEG